MFSAHRRLAQDVEAASVSINLQLRTENYITTERTHSWKTLVSPGAHGLKEPGPRWSRLRPFMDKPRKLLRKDRLPRTWPNRSSLQESRRRSRRIVSSAWHGGTRQHLACSFTGAFTACMDA